MPPPCYHPRTFVIHATLRARHHLVTLCVVAVLAGQWHLLGQVLRTLPSVDESRSPSSDVLMQSLPLRHSSDVFDALARDLPHAGGIVVAHGTAAALTSAYMVAAMRLWPRPVAFVACRPAPALAVRPVGPVAWRIDLAPGASSPLTARASTTRDAGVLCANTPGGE